MAKKKAKKEVSVETRIEQANKLVATGKMLGDVDMVLLGITTLQELNALPEIPKVNGSEPVVDNDGQYNDTTGIYVSARRQNSGPANFVADKRACRNEPINVRNKKNKFVPPQDLDTKESRIDKLLTEGLVRSERRDAIVYRTLICEWCNRQFQQHPDIAVGVVGGGGGKVCDRCLTGAKG